MQCDDGDIRLLTGEIRGPLEVCVSKRWATVYSLTGRPWPWYDADETDVTVATVACRQLGYDSGKRYKIHHDFTVA